MLHLAVEEAGGSPEVADATDAGVAEVCPADALVVLEIPVPSGLCKLIAQWRQIVAETADFWLVTVSVAEPRAEDVRRDRKVSLGAW